jgi:exodeoxyribonuclease V alpha subunit
MPELELTTLQKEALDKGLTEPATVITGGPGTGKTSCLKEVVYQFRQQKLSIALCAPTGKAAKRMTEQIGMTAMTIHRLLRYIPGEGFEFNADTPLPHDVLIVDEVSMVDSILMASLMDACHPRMIVILVGDADQLPSIGPGNVLRDIIDSRALPVTRLTHVHRFDDHSWININAKRINSGQMVELDPDSIDFFFLEADEPEEVQGKILNLVTNEIPRKHDFVTEPIRDIQVLALQHNGPLGTKVFNSLLIDSFNQRYKNTKLMKSKFSEFADGDKVIHTKNNYGLAVFNGEVGIVQDVNPKNRTLSVDFGDRVVQYGTDDVNELVHAFAFTVHKSQGSEFPVVVFPVHSTNSYMLSRNLLYTAITRAQKAVYLVGNKKGLKWGIRNNKIVRRNTFLREFLEQSVAK